MTFIRSKSFHALTLAAVSGALLLSRSASAQTNDTYAFNNERWANSQGGWVGTDWLAGDFNGDGKTDMAVVYNDNGYLNIDVHLSTGTAFVLQRWATDQGAFPDEVGFVVADFDGDGRDDIGKVFAVNGLIDIDAHLSTGSSFYLDRWATNQGAWVNGAVPVGGNFNGDRYGDIAYIFPDAYGMIDIDVHPSNGSSFGIQRWANDQGEWIGDDSQWLGGDFNGDGRTDLALAWNDYGDATVDVHVSSGSGFSGSRWINSSFEWPDGGQWFVTDMNGDGYADLGLACDQQSISGGTVANALALEPYFSNGSFFVQNPSDNLVTFAQSTWITQGMAFRGGDFNGDGMGDWSDPWNENGTIDIDTHLNTAPSTRHF